MAHGRSIWTIGHSNHGVDDFLGLLAGERIEFVADVRSFPFSRFAPQFNQGDLKRALGSTGVGYVFLGVELGGRPSRDEHYDAEGHALYGPMSLEPGFKNAIQRLKLGVKSHRIALLCSEGHPEHCHRRLLVGKVLTDEGLVLHHILPDATVVREERVTLDSGAQPALFGGAPTAWRSTQSVSHRRRLSTSSAA